MKVLSGVGLRHVNVANLKAARVEERVLWSVSEYTESISRFV